MNQQRPETDEENLSRTLFGIVQGRLDPLQGLSAPFGLGGVVGLTAGLVLLVFVPDLRSYSHILLGLGAVLVTISMIISFRTVGQAVTSRSGRYGTNTAIMIAVFIGIAALVNFLTFENSKRIDVTSTKQFDLAPRTELLLENLREPVEAKVFFGPPGSLDEEAFQGQVENMLREFEVRTNKFSYEFIDPDRNPEEAREYSLQRYGNTVFEGMESQRRHQMSSGGFLEQEFVTGLLIVTGEEQKQVYFLTGHGERDVQDRQETTDGFGFAADGIQAENYATSTLNLSVTDELEGFQAEVSSDGVNMVVIAGPRRELLPDEKEVLDNYLDQGGNLLVLLDPETPKSFREFLAPWGVIVGDGQIVDRSGSVAGKENIMILDPDRYFRGIPEESLDSLLSVGDITGTLGTTIYPGVTPLEPSPGVAFVPEIFEFPDPDFILGEESGVFGVALARTSPNSELIDLPPALSSTGDFASGSYYPAMAIKAYAPLDRELPEDFIPTSVASLVVFGDSDFASNPYFFDAFNSDIFLNSVNWLVGDTPIANIRPKPIAFRALVINDDQSNFMRFSSWLLLPTLMAITGGLVWWRRR